MVMCWKYFGAIVLKLALLKSPVTTNAASGYAFPAHLYSHTVPWVPGLCWLEGECKQNHYDRCKFPRYPEWSTQKHMNFQIRGAEGFNRVTVSGFKSRCPCWQGWSIIAVNPRFLVWVDADYFCRNYVFYTLPDKTRYRIWIRLYIVIRRCPEHVPVHVLKIVL